MTNLRPVKPSKKVAAFLRPEDVERLIRCIRADAEIKETEPGQITWLIDVVLVAVSTGLRLGELINLRWQDVDLETRFLTIRSGADFRTKSGHERRVPVAGDALTVLRRLAAEKRSPYVFTGLENGSRLNPNYVSRRFSHYRKMAMLADGISFHSLRHTCASWLVMKGVSLPIVQGILGHSSLSVTQRYAHLAPDSLQKEMDRVFVGGLAG